MNQFNFSLWANSALIFQIIVFAIFLVLSPAMTLALTGIYIVLSLLIQAMDLTNENNQ